MTTAVTVAHSVCLWCSIGQPDRQCAPVFFPSADDLADFQEMIENSQQQRRARPPVRRLPPRGRGPYPGGRYTPPGAVPPPPSPLPPPPMSAPVDMPPLPEPVQSADASESDSALRNGESSA